MKFVAAVFLVVLCAFVAECNNENINDPTRILKRSRRIVGGWSVLEQHYPYVVALSEKTKGHFCGGTVMNSQWVLTAAHCVHNKDISSFYVVIHDVGNFTVERVVMKEFDNYLMVNDIALLKLNTFNNPLYEAQISQRRAIFPKAPITIGSECFILGYGYTKYYGETTTDLQIANIKYITLEQCEAKLGRVGTPEPYWGMFCAEGDNGVDACNGDSGGPIVCRDTEGSEKLVLHGITSYGVGCGTPGVPGVYTSVHFHLQWILDKIAVKTNKIAKPIGNWQKIRNFWLVTQWRG